MKHVYTISYRECRDCLVDVIAESQEEAELSVIDGSCNEPSQRGKVYVDDDNISVLEVHKTEEAE